MALLGGKIKRSMLGSHLIHRLLFITVRALVMLVSGLGRVCARGNECDGGEESISLLAGGIRPECPV